MIKLFAFITLTLVAGIAEANTPSDNIYNNCQQIMTTSTNCRVALDNKKYPLGGLTLVSNIGWVKNEAIINLRATGYTLDSDGKFAMCAAARAGCLQSWESETCRYARGQWKSTAPTTGLALLWQEEAPTIFVAALAP